MPPKLRRSATAFRKAAHTAGTPVLPQEPTPAPAPRAETPGASPWIRGFHSSWVRGVRRVKTSGQDDLDVEFKDGAICRYANKGYHYPFIIRASSKGKYVHAHLYNLPYTEVAA